MIEIPISIQVEQRSDTLAETVDMKRKQKQRQFVTIESIDDTTSTLDSGLDQIQTEKVGIISIRKFSSLSNI